MNIFICHVKSLVKIIPVSWYDDVGEDAAVDEATELDMLPAGLDSFKLSANQDEYFSV